MDTEGPYSDELTAPDPNTDVGQILELIGRTTHLERLLTVVTSRVGPIQVRPSEYHAAQVTQLRPMHTDDPATGADNDAPMVWALPEHLTVKGLVTSEARVAEALIACDSSDPLDQARAVLLALGLPVRETN